MKNPIKAWLLKLNIFARMRHSTTRPKLTPREWLKNNIKRILTVVGAMIAVGLAIFSIPKIAAQYDTYVDIPQHFTAQERNQVITRLNDIRNSLEKGKNNAGMYNNIGILRGGVKDYRGAIRAFKTAKARNPEDARFDRNMGITYKYMGDYDNAEKAFLHAMAQEPKQPEFWLELGELYTYYENNPVKAKLFYLQALEKNSENIEILKSYANFSQNIDMDFHEASKYWTILSEKDPVNKNDYLKNAADAQSRIK